MKRQLILDRNIYFFSMIFFVVNALNSKVNIIQLKFPIKIKLTLIKLLKVTDRLSHCHIPWIVIRV